MGLRSFTERREWCIRADSRAGMDIGPITRRAPMLPGGTITTAGRTTGLALGPRVEGLGAARTFAAAIRPGTEAVR